MNELEQAIKERLVLEVSYDGGMRLIEPYVLFVDKEGCKLVRVWQVDGFTHHPGSLPQWRSFKVEKISEARVLRTYFEVRPDLHVAMEGLDVANVVARVGEP